MQTQAIRYAGTPAAGPPAPAAPDLPPSPLKTQVIQQHAETAPFDAVEGEPETEKVHLVEPAADLDPPAPPTEPLPVEPPPAEPPAIPAAAPPAVEPPAVPAAELPAAEPTPAEPIQDIRQQPLPPPSGGMGEILPSLDGFDTTLGPGVEVPESMQRARENVAKAQETESESLADLYSRPIQLPPVAGFWVRALALLADGVWVGLLELAGWHYLKLPGLALAGAVGLLVILAGWSVWGTSPGKRLLRLYVCTADGQAGLGLPRTLLRLVGYLLSGLLLGIGFLMALSSSRQALHDRLAGTTVRRFR